MIQVERHICPTSPICCCNVHLLRAKGQTWIEEYSDEEAYQLFGIGRG